MLYTGDATKRFTLQNYAIECSKKALMTLMEVCVIYEMNLGVVATRFQNMAFAIKLLAKKEMEVCIGIFSLCTREIN